MASEKSDAAGCKVRLGVLGFVTLAPWPLQVGATETWRMRPRLRLLMVNKARAGKDPLEPRNSHQLKQAIETGTRCTRHTTRFLLLAGITKTNKVFGFSVQTVRSGCLQMRASSGCWCLIPTCCVNWPSVQTPALIAKLS